MLAVVTASMLILASTAVATAARTQASAQAAAAAVRVDHAWVRAAPPGMDMAAGYMVVHNLGRTPLRLVAASSEAWAVVELHRSEVADGVSRMRRAGAQVIAAGAALDIAAGGLHWMLMQPRRAVRPGDVVRFTLQFAGGQQIQVQVPVRTSAP